MPTGSPRLQELLGIDFPIIQGPFGGGASSVKLVQAVSENGGLGSFGAHYLAPSEIIKLVSDIRAATSKPFAINLWVSDHDQDGLIPAPAKYERATQRLAPYFAELKVPLPERPARTGQVFSEQIEALLQARPPVFSFVFGIPSPDILARCRELGIVTLGTATTVAEAQALESAGVDAVVASGFEAGGHRGSFLRSAEESLTGTFSLIPKVVDQVKIPVIAAGGIADVRGIVAALALGASGVQIGTAYLACDESGAYPLHRQMLHSSAAEQTVLTRVYTGRLARGIPNRLVKELTQHPEDVLPYPAQSWLLGQIKSEAVNQKKSEFMSLWCGQAAALIKYRSAAELTRELIRETRSTLESKNFGL